MTSYFGSKLSGIALAVFCIAIPLLTGAASARISGDQMKSFGLLNQPPFSPPAWVFPVVWSILYIMMGIALLLMVRSDHEYKAAAVGLFFIQLLLNFFWSPLFFVGRRYTAAAIVLLLMLLSTSALAVVAWNIDTRASLLLMPYIAWMCFATYLNVGVGILNS